MAPKKAKSVLSGLKLDAKRYVPLLTKLMAESESLQNNPAQGLYPREDNCSQHVLEALAPKPSLGLCPLGPPPSNRLRVALAPKGPFRYFFTFRPEVCIVLNRI